MGMLLASRMKHDAPLVADWYPCAASNPHLLLATGFLVAAGLVGNTLAGGEGDGGGGDGGGGEGDGGDGGGGGGDGKGGVGGGGGGGEEEVGHRLQVLMHLLSCFSLYTWHLCLKQLYHDVSRHGGGAGGSTIMHVSMQ